MHGWYQKINKCSKQGLKHVLKLSNINIIWPVYVSKPPASQLLILQTFRDVWPTSFYIFIYSNVNVELKQVRIRRIIDIYRPPSCHKNGLQKISDWIAKHRLACVDNKRKPLYLAEMARWRHMVQDVLAVDIGRTWHIHSRPGRKHSIDDKQMNIVYKLNISWTWNGCRMNAGRHLSEHDHVACRSCSSTKGK